MKITLLQALGALSIFHDVPEEAFTSIEFEDGSRRRFNYKVYGQALYIDFDKISVSKIDKRHDIV